MTDLADLIARAAESPPESGDFREVGGVLVWIRLPIPGPLNHINVWLLETAGGWVLVDTGMAIPEVEEAWRQLESRLPALGRVERILVTHHHPDHFGMAARLAAARGIEVSISEAAAAASRLDHEPGHFTRVLADFADRLGFEPEPEFGEFLSGRRYRSIISGAPPRLGTLVQDQEIASRAGTFRVSLHDGHAPGHACLHAADTGLLVSGDQVLPHISPNISLYPEIADEDPLGDYLDSLDQLGALPAATVVLPAHGRPFTGLKTRTDALRAEHEQRLGRIVEACRPGARTGEVAATLFRLPRLDALNRLLATAETLAHLRYLERRGRVSAVGHGPELRWVSA
ncbi:MAG: MBL fold metallo-hydrolase [Steroidobacteraceae bacterium]|jgi:glyoxylase-like metal-dependent hydrolase (beta-lactamase superfamily II)|nr:MBL fold metallo-hydrolase [Steroidobacteraceae bacterium]